MMPFNPTHTYTYKIMPVHTHRRTWKQTHTYIYLFVELELWHCFIYLIQTEVLEQQKAWVTEKRRKRRLITVMLQESTLRLYRAWGLEGTQI
jgi:hypothetical protein